MILRAFALVAVIGLGACTPSDGPTSSRIQSDARADNVPILQLQPSVLQALGKPAPNAGLSHFMARPYTPGTIKPGDIVSVRIFQTSEDGVFSVADSNVLDLGDFAVQPGGSVSVPFVGNIRVAGSSVVSAQRVITDRLRETAIDPQATVSISLSASDNYTVQGSVAQGGTYPLTPRGERILDAVAAGGGSAGKPENTIVSLIRGGNTGRQSLDRIIADPGQNVPLQPGDIVVVGGGDATFIADGAVGSAGEFNFVEGQFSLAQAIARAGGLQDSRANARAVYLFRRQPPGESFLLRRANGETDRIFGDVIFRADYKDPTDRLNAREFQLRNGDVLFVGNAPLANFAKFFQIFERPPEVPAPPSLESPF
ncbi:polysaccharide biosynthesis/export family protein [Thalassococcus sp. S3]|uniref:polysaccharide biosynthesis/export family protein n=1 Tax=Thalassococcus sp. S3 TaxID=2017482 RepID=UPI0010241479|nr:polysaccharide biosynthesis/export family protein [Thalassococcus sp. S3]QBF32483.1 hypothetical protein CFI11_14845 [Thalassococcus sp. S3]